MARSFVTRSLLAASLMALPLVACSKGEQKLQEVQADQAQSAADEKARQAEEAKQQAAETFSRDQREANEKAQAVLDKANRDTERQNAIVDQKVAQAEKAAVEARDESAKYVATTLTNLDKRIEELKAKPLSANAKITKGAFDQKVKALTSKSAALHKDAERMGTQTGDVMKASYDKLRFDLRALEESIDDAESAVR